MFGAKLLSKKLPFNNRDTSVYAALRNGSEDDSNSPSEKDFDEPVFARRRANRSSPVFSWAVILLLVSTNIITITGLLAIKHLSEEKGAAEPEYTPKSAGKVFSRVHSRRLLTTRQHVYRPFLLNGNA